MKLALIRRARRSETPAIAAVLSEAFREYEAEYTPAAFAATTLPEAGLRLRWEEGPVWVAVVNAKVVGTVAAACRRRELFVRSMAIVPAARGQGLGAALLARVERYARTKGCIRLALTTTPFLSRAIQLYERYGFVRGSKAPLDLYGTPLLEMVKRLQ